MSDINRIGKKDKELDEEFAQQGFSKTERMNARLNIWLSVLRDTRWPPDVRAENIITRYERRIGTEILVKKLARRINNREVELKVLIHLQKNSYRIKNLLKDNAEKDVYLEYRQYLSGYSEGSKKQIESLKFLQEVKADHNVLQEPSQNFIDLWKDILDVANESEENVYALANKRYYQEFIGIEMEKGRIGKRFWKRYLKLIRKCRKISKSSILPDPDKVITQLVNDYNAKLNSIDSNLPMMDPQRLAVVAQVFAAFDYGINLLDKTPDPEIQQIENKIERATEKIDKLLKY